MAPNKTHMWAISQNLKNRFICTKTMALNVGWIPPRYYNWAGGGGLCLLHHWPQILTKNLHQHPNFTGFENWAHILAPTEVGSAHDLEIWGKPHPCLIIAGFLCQIMDGFRRIQIDVV